MDHRLPATLDMAREFRELFVNRRAYTIQSLRPHPESGRHYYYRPKPKNGGEPAELTGETVRRHLAGEITIGLYAINAATQRCKWMAIDADYKTALEDLIKVQRQLQNDGIAAALEKSKRGGHLWISSNGRYWRARRVSTSTTWRGSSMFRSRALGSPTESRSSRSRTS
jgi:hypothetical protein